MIGLGIFSMRRTTRDIGFPKTVSISNEPEQKYAIYMR